MKTNAECAEIVLKWATDSAIGAHYKRTKLDCDEYGRRLAEKMWAERNPDDEVGGFGINPYREPSYKQKEVQKARDELEATQCVLAFVQHQICQGLTTVKKH